MCASYGAHVAGSTALIHAMRCHPGSSDAQQLRRFLAAFQARMEPLGIVVFSCIMGTAGFSVILEVFAPLCVPTLTKATCLFPGILGATECGCTSDVCAFPCRRCGSWSTAHILTCPTPGWSSVSAPPPLLRQIHHPGCGTQWKRHKTEAVCLGLVLASHVCSTAVPEHLGCKGEAASRCQ